MKKAEAFIEYKSLDKSKKYMDQNCDIWQFVPHWHEWGLGESRTLLSSGSAYTAYIPYVSRYFSKTASELKKILTENRYKELGNAFEGESQVIFERFIEFNNNKNKVRR